MMRLRCPLCGKEFESAGPHGSPSFPFCSERCRLVDLGRWLDEAYVVPGDARPDDEGEAAPPVADAPTDE